MDRFADSFPLQQFFNLLSGSRIRFLDQLPHNTVGRGVRPVGLWKRIIFSYCSFNVVNNAPGIIDFLISERITVIPLLYLRHFSFQPIVIGHFPDFFFCKTKSISKIRTCDRKNIQIIQPCKNAFSADPEAACDYRKFQIRISLQGRFQQ